MSINSHLSEMLQEFLATSRETISNQQLISCIDLTLLNEQTSLDDLTTLNHLANQHHVAAVCVFPKDLAHFTLSAGIDLATVINFPQANQSIDICLAQIDFSVQNGAKEIDYVVPYMDYLSSKKQQALEHAATIASYCKEQNLRLKVILETGAFSNLVTLHELALELLTLDIDFLKTSTGKTPQGASLAAVFTLLSAIKDSGKNCGIKISGGVKTIEQAKAYASLSHYFRNKVIDKSWFRIGASSLLEELIN